jgi:hypothetical protein
MPSPTVRSLDSADLCARNSLKRLNRILLVGVPRGDGWVILSLEVDVNYSEIQFHLRLTAILDFITVCLPSHLRRVIHTSQHICKMVRTHAPFPHPLTSPHFHARPAPAACIFHKASHEQPAITEARSDS